VLEERFARRHKRRIASAFREEDGARIGIEQECSPVEPVAPLRCPGAIGPVGVGLAPACAVDERMSDVTRAMVSGVQIERQYRRGTCRALEQKQFDPSGMAAEDGEVQAVATVLNTRRQGPSGGHAEILCAGEVFAFVTGWRTSRR
jgi:hypothetical protein